MDDLTAFDRQIAAEIDHQVGPPLPVDPLAITRLASTLTPGWSFRAMLSPAKALIVGALALAIGVAVVMVQPSRQENVTIPAADPGASILVLEDGTDDFHAVLDFRVKMRGPGVADLVNVTVSVEGDRLAVRFETAEPVSLVPTAIGWIFYRLHIDTDGDAEPEYELRISDSDAGGDLIVYMEDLTDGSERVEGADPRTAVVDGAITVSVALDALPVAPSQMRFAASSEFSGTDYDAMDVFTWPSMDRVPDDEGAWLAPGEPAQRSSPMP